GAHVAPVAYLGATDFDGPHSGLDCPIRPMAMAHDTVAAIRQFQIFPQGDKGIGFGDQHLSQHAAGAFTCKFAQRIVDGLTLTERKNSGISRHGVSLLSGGSGRLDTRLDTPPSRSSSPRFPHSSVLPVSSPTAQCGTQEQSIENDLHQPCQWAGPSQAIATTHSGTNCAKTSRRALQGCSSKT